ncbi:hypothetical protein G9A89_001427 [Geosiphon pyriformis]|nr:hypothetical protein G9A89_001427 [Geosiphon pyriformis]
MTSTFGRFQFQSKQQKEDLLGLYGMYFEGFKLQSPMPSEIQSPLPQPDFGVATLWKLLEEEEKRTATSTTKSTNPTATRTTSATTTVTTTITAATTTTKCKPNGLRTHCKAIIANNWDNTKALQTIPYFLKETANSWYQSLATRPQTFQQFKTAFLEYFSNNNSINCLANTFTTIKQNNTEAVTTYLGCFHRVLCQIQAINTMYFTEPQIFN